MKKRVLVALVMGIMGIQSVYAVNNVGLKPQSNNAQQNLSGQTVSEKRDQLSVSLRHVPNPDLITVQHPNGYGKKGDTFSPYGYSDVVNTSLFEVTIVNTGTTPIEMTNLRVEVSRDTLPVHYYEKKDLVEKWNRYYYLNTNTVTGAPNFMEQERALAAEKHILLHSFSPLDLPPGATVKGYLATEPLEDGRNIKIEVFNLLPGQAAGDFTFYFTKT